jgi:hypothetical protein
MKRMCGMQPQSRDDIVIKLQNTQQKRKLLHMLLLMLADVFAAQITQDTGKARDANTCHLKTQPRLAGLHATLLNTTAPVAGN